MKNKLKLACLYGNEFTSFFDHAAKLAIYLDIPLILSEKTDEDLARKYYPNIKIKFINPKTFTYQMIKEFDLIFCPYTKDYLQIDFLFFEKQLNKKLKSIWYPHGNSDKIIYNPCLSQIENDEIVLAYGNKMIDMFKLLKKQPKHAFIGNYRNRVYQKNKLFFDKIIEKEISSNLPSSNKTILFAPTHDDGENFSFFETIYLLLKNLPDDFNLIVKPHPRTYHYDIVSMEKISYLCSQKKNVLFLDKFFTLIYPLLNYVDIYLGDMSSIGYDFLTFNKPMFFFNPQKRDKKSDIGLFLFQCGIEIMPDLYDKIFDIIEKNIIDDAKFSKIRKKVYQYTFEEDCSDEKIKEGIFSICK
jgi:teichoic acid glycerol-phosphate primase